MGKWTDSDTQNWQKENEGSAYSSSNIAKADHCARQDAALDQVSGKDDHGLPADYAISKTIERVQENDPSGGSGK